MLYCLPPVAFTLRVTQGDDAAEELSFDAGEVRMGRTADNDVVIKDPSSSRSHARVYEEDGVYFVEDLKSANGTTLNDRDLTAPAKLKAGDRIAIGTVVMEFSPSSGPSSTLDGEDDAEDPNQTLLKPPAKPVSKPVSAVAKAPARKLTDPGKQAFEPTAPKGQALRKPTGAIAAVAPAPKPVPVPVEEEPLLPTAAERARERRELQRSNLGKLQVLWNEFPKPTRIAFSIIGGLMTLGVLAGLVSAVMPKRTARRVEVSTLTPNGDVLPDSFGEGPGVDFERTDMKSFNFTFAAPTAIVGILHYQARDIGKEEVTIELNGQQLGTIPPDTTETETRQLELVLPATQLKLNEPNEVVFDNVGNPPASDPWRIWNVQVDVIPVPRLSPEEAGRRAKDDLERAAKFYELRTIGSMNTFRSWKQYRDAWLILEATPDAPKELIQLARTRMREIRPELDKRCAAMLVTYQRAMNQRYPDIRAARLVLQDVPSYFEKEHPCLGMSRALQANLEELNVDD
jgi:pSer/pThr/pTyr-binding forkhead associated (FHA) protein